MTDKAYEVPLHEQLARVPRDARLVIDDADGMGTRFIPVGRYCHEATDALRAALAQPEQEPVAWMYDWYDETEDIDGVPIGGIVHDWISKDYDEAHSPTMGCHNIRPLYTAPPQCEWQGLTDEELLDIADMAYANDLELLQTLQTKLKEKNSTTEKNIQTSDKND